MSEIDPDPNAPGENPAVLGGRPAPTGDDPTAGGRRGQIGEAPSIAADEPDDDGPPLPPGGGTGAEEPDAPPVADPGPGE